MSPAFPTHAHPTKLRIWQEVHGAIISSCVKDNMLAASFSNKSVYHAVNLCNIASCGDLLLNAVLYFCM